MAIAVPMKMNELNTGSKAFQLQAKLKPIDADELADFIVQCIQLSASGGRIVFSMSEKNAKFLSWHPYLSRFISRFAPYCIEEPNENTAPVHSDEKSLIANYHFYHKKFQQAYTLLNEITPLGKSVRTMSMSDVSPEKESDTCWLSGVIFNPDPLKLAGMRQAVEEAALLFKTHFTSNQEFYQHKSGAPIKLRFENLEDAELALGKMQLLRDQLIRNLNILASQKRTEFELVSAKIYDFYLRMAGCWARLSSSFNGKQSDDHNFHPEPFENLKAEFLSYAMEFEKQFHQHIGITVKWEGDFNYPELNIYMSKLQDALANYVSDCHAYADTYVKRVNTGIAGHEEISRIYDAIQNALNSVNQSGLLKEKIEINSRNYYQVYNSLDNICREWSENIKYLKIYPGIRAWNHFLSNQDASLREVILHLQQFSWQEWVSRFNDAVESITRKRWVHPAMPHDMNLVKDASEYSVNMWKWLAEQDLQLISSPENHTSKNAGAGFLEKLGSLISGAEKKTSLQRTLQYKGQFEWHVINASDPEISVRYYGLDGEEQFWDLEVISDECINDLASIHQKMEDYPVMERFSVAKILAENLLKNMSAPRVFQTRNTNIISVLPDEILARVLVHLESAGAKEFRGRLSLEDAIIESFLETNRKQILLVFNGLLDDARPDTAVRQYQVMSKIQLIGYKLIPVWSVDLVAEDTSSWIVPLLREL